MVFAQQLLKEPTTSKISSPAKYRPLELGASDIADVFYHEGENVGCTLEDRYSGAMIMMKRGTLNGRPVVYTRSLYFHDPASEDFQENVREALLDHDRWELYDVFGE